MKFQQRYGILLYFLFFVAYLCWICTQIQWFCFAALFTQVNGEAWEWNHFAFWPFYPEFIFKIPMVLCEWVCVSKLCLLLSLENCSPKIKTKIIGHLERRKECWFVLFCFFFCAAEVNQISKRFFSHHSKSFSWLSFFL